MRKFRWGILGTARIAEQQMIPALHQSPTSELVAVASRDPEKGKAYAAKNSIPRVYSTYEALLEDHDIDAVYLPLPNHLHATWTIKAAEHGKHVLCEKPAALNAREVEALGKACEDRKVVFMEAFMYQFHPQWDRVKAIIDSGEIGDVRIIQSHFTGTMRRQDDYRLQSVMGGGALYDVGCYCVHATRMLLGQEPLNVTAQAQMDQGIDRSLAAVMSFPGGTLAHFDCSFDAYDRQQVEIIGRQGTILVESAFRPDWGEPTLSIRSGVRERRETLPQVNTYLMQIEHFQAVIEKKVAPRNDQRQALLNMQVIDAIYQAVKANES